AANSPVTKLIPVPWPPGRGRLATRPSRTGSSAIVKTIGIVVVAAFAASVTAGPWTVAITATGGEPDRRPALAAGRTDPPPNGIRSPRSRPQRSRYPSSLDETRADSPYQSTRHPGPPSPASPA